MLRRLIIFSVATLVNATAGAEQVRQPPPDAAAHLGISYLITMTAYGIFKKPLRMGRGPALLFAVPVAVMAGLLKEANDENPEARDVKNNLLGIGLAVGTVYVFEF